MSPVPGRLEPHRWAVATAESIMEMSFTMLALRGRQGRLKARLMLILRRAFGKLSPGSSAIDISNLALVAASSCLADCLTWGPEYSEQAVQKSVHDAILSNLTSAQALIKA